MFVKHIIKTLHVSVTIVWPSSGGRLSCLVLLLPSLLVCVVKLFIWYVAVCCQQYNVCIRMFPWFFFPKIWRKVKHMTERVWTYLSVCVPDVLVCGICAHIPQTSTSGTHTYRQHTATYQMNNLTTQTSREGSNSTKHERRPPEDGQTIVTEACRVLIMCFTNIFNNLVF